MHLTCPLLLTLIHTLAYQLHLTATESYPIKQLFDAANTPIAVCPVTNFAIATPFKPLAWAQRLAATRYPNPAAAVTLVKCLRVGVDLGFYGNRDVFRSALIWKVLLNNLMLLTKI